MYGFAAACLWCCTLCEQKFLLLDELDDDNVDRTATGGQIDVTNVKATWSIVSPCCEVIFVLLLYCNYLSVSEYMCSSVAAVYAVIAVCLPHVGRAAADAR